MGQRKVEGDQEQGDEQEKGNEEKDLQERDKVEEVCEETTEMNVEQRLPVLASWTQTVKYITESSVFIDEAGFHINMKANRAWDPRGQMIVVTTLRQKHLHIPLLVPYHL
ncbi:hypothetical protein G6F57_011477 [Rhizopus arrhizus]|uniref:Uncharacterized protein n=1 Tax=Rhizopus oryzae TaxID=64495 RepID=A0A9P7BRD8_RHIOR|nr:hypothetical protein G6F30_008451 [Rhizopus arrhizus]KAG1419963.1 hypothetical protein G6F58_004383 [Rhizopus delemar]KAG0979291.1 hypothetical protein G6F29_008693 [Rhizopus arrhizus]KAG0992075.1 hypothetical protein G6F28_007984 [Rhizopus arrhizus]KAG1007744.1 hypothetical protein G6F27_007126 [Rhizopus arrhizus]